MVDDSHRTVEYQVCDNWDLSTIYLVFRKKTPVAGGNRYVNTKYLTQKYEFKFDKSSYSWNTMIFAIFVQKPSISDLNIEFLYKISNISHFCDYGLPCIILAKTFAELGISYYIFILYFHFYIAFQYIRIVSKLIHMYTPLFYHFTVIFICLTKC